MNTINTDLLFELLIPGSLALGGILLGIIFQILIHRRAVQWTRKTKWRGDDVLLRSLSGVAILWFSILGIHLGLRFANLPPKVLGILGKATMAAAIFSVVWVAARFTSGMILHYGNRLQGRIPSLTLFSNLARLLIYLVGGLVIFQTLGIAVTPALTALGVGGLAVALALQDTLANLFSGFHIAVSGQLRPGDFVKLDSGEEGFVEDIGWRNTTVRKIRNNMVVIPNSKLAASVITNYNLPKKEMAILVPVGVSYDSDLERVEEVTKEVGHDVMKTVPGGVPDFEPLVRFHTFNDSSIDMNVVLRCGEYTHQYLLKHEFIKKLHARYRREGIEIPFPIRTVHMAGQ